MRKLTPLTALAVSSLCVLAQAQAAPYQMENLGRGVVAMRTSGSQVYIGWRLLGLDPANISFNVYRSTNGGTPTKLNSTPISATTDYIDTTSTVSAANVYTVRPVVNGTEQTPSAAYTLPASAPTQQFIEIPLQRPAGGTTPSGEAYSYNVQDSNIGDLDGDGEYEIVIKWSPSNEKDPSQNGYTGPAYYDAYKLNGTRLWRINLGRNIRAGAHYNSYIVYDFDGNGKAELIAKTADGTVSGTGQVVGDASADWRNSTGRILAGPEFLTVFNGESGAVLQTVSFVPARGNVADWGDDYGNRVDRFQDGVAYVDGQRPSLISGRGEYTRLVRSAWDYRNGSMTRRWTFDSNSSGNSAYFGLSHQQMRVADVDGDGRQEILNGASAINDNGAGLWTTVNGGDGDAQHVGDFLPDRAGLETWYCLEEAPSSASGYGLQLRDAGTGAFIWGLPVIGDIGRCLAGDIEPNRKGHEFWGLNSGGFFDAAGTIVSTAMPAMSFMIWWDADLSREILNSNQITKWNGSSIVSLFTGTGYSSINGSKATPVVSADILGDWREEFVLTNNDRLRLYSTTIKATNRLATLMHDPQYRVQVGNQNSGSNQPPNPGFYLGTGMSARPQPRTDIVYVTGGGTTPPPTGDTYQAESAALGGGTVAESINGGFFGSGYANAPMNGGTITFNNVDGNGGGAKSLAIRYANGGSASRTGNLVINGTTTSITFPSTGSWTSWSVLNVTINLNNNSSNTIRFASTGNELGNIDQITVP